jgi:ADP-ribose pyrophosphatase YjhB (NUDIX family)
MKSKDYKCSDNCCLLKIDTYESPKFKNYYRNRKKAGVCIYDPNTDKVLIVQSRGNFWGSPKGGLNINETERACAIREVKEETGMIITSTEFKKAIKIKNRAIYFYIERNECNVDIQKNYKDNDANGIGWIKVNCLVNAIKSGDITLNKHAQIVFKKFLNINLD